MNERMTDEELATDPLYQPTTDLEFIVARLRALFEELPSHDALAPPDAPHFVGRARSEIELLLAPHGAKQRVPKSEPTWSEFYHACPSCGFSDPHWGVRAKQGECLCVITIGCQKHEAERGAQTPVTVQEQYRVGSCAVCLVQHNARAWAALRPAGVWVTPVLGPQDPERVLDIRHCGCGNTISRSVSSRQDLVELLRIYGVRHTDPSPTSEPNPYTKEKRTNMVDPFELEVPSSTPTEGAVAYQESGTGRYMRRNADGHTEELTLVPRAVVDGLAAALAPLLAIADAYDDNDLDDEARKRWGRNLEHENDTPPERIQLYHGRGGKPLLTLAQCFAAREAVLRASTV